MKTKQLMLDEIYSIVADKTLKFGCKIKVKDISISLSDSKIIKLKEKYGRCLIQADFEKEDEELNGSFGFFLQEGEFSVKKLNERDGVALSGVDVFGQIRITGKGYGEHNVQKEERKNYNIDFNKGITFENWNKPEGYISEIIGNPITLSRILFWLNNKSNRQVEFSKYGKLNVCEWSFIEIYSDTGWGDIWKTIDWDLSKETLDEQSKETIQKLHEVITLIHNGK